MTMNELIDEITRVTSELVVDFNKIKDKGNKKAGARARKATLLLAKLGKDFRKASIEELGY